MKLDIYKYQNKRFNNLISLFFEKMIQNGDHIMIFCDDEKKLQTIDKLLWEYNQSSWVPHLKTDDIFADKAQIVLSNDIQNNTNSAKILCMIDSNITEIADITKFDRVIYFIPVEIQDYTNSISVLTSKITDCNIYNQQSNGKWIKHN